MTKQRFLRMLVTLRGALPLIAELVLLAAIILAAAL